MSDQYQTVLADIFQTEPQVVPTIPYPSMLLLTRVTKTYTKLLSVGSSRRKRQLAAIRTYNIFKDLGVHQLQRMIKTTLKIIKELSEAEYQALVD
ncbi:33937_t:CDS:2 [Gigaspora margarita]|uniref:33937_t:CDS:1 n=1 Tax=Gigaspora margarita TaxID=4874 RepID=A0ABN7U6V1_GIGMA|nr:33937_t:CDS:2 [Gigaspora margarita]